MNIINPDNVRVTPMAKALIKKLDKQLGWEYKYSIDAEIKNADWKRAHVPQLHLARAQVMVLRATNIEHVIGVVLLFEHPDWQQSGVNTGVLYIASNHIWKDKRSPVVIGIPGCGIGHASKSCLYATTPYDLRVANFAGGSDCFLDQPKIPANFAAQLTRFVGLLKTPPDAYGSEKNRRWLQSFVPQNTIEPHPVPELIQQRYEFAVIQRELEGAVNEKLAAFSSLLEELYTNHIYEGTATHANSGIEPKAYLQMQLFKDSRVLKSLLETHEAQTNTHCLEEIDKLEEEVADFQKFAYKACVAVYRPTTRTLYRYTDDAGQVIEQWFRNYAAFEKTVGAEITVKLEVLNASMGSASDSHTIGATGKLSRERSPFIAGMGLAYDEQIADSAAVEQIEVRTYFLDCQ